MKKLAQVGVLCKMFNIQPEELIKQSKTVYQWQGIFYEVTGFKSRTAPASHYTTVEYAGKKWSLRELGNKSQIMKNYKLGIYKTK